MFKLISDSKKLPKNTVLVELSDGKEVKFYNKGSEEKLIFGTGSKLHQSTGQEKKGEMNSRRFFVLCRKIIRTAKSYKIKKLALNFSEFDFPKVNFSPEEKAKIMAEQFTVANFDFNKYKKEKGGASLEEIFIIVPPKFLRDKNLSQQALKKEFERGYLVGKEVNLCRELANTPGGEITPIMLAQKSKEACKNTKIKVTIFDEKKIKELKMGAVLGVSKGSPEKPRFIVMEYWGRNGKPSSTPPSSEATDGHSKTSADEEKPIVLVGKGVTFDTGGLSLKPSDSMLGMHLDMSGGAIVIHAMATIAKLGLKKNVIGLVPAVENTLSGTSYRPGDILTTMSGKTVEVLNTDAEGRLILADALTYAERYSPRLVVDVATLTGAAVVALGERCSAIFTKDKKIQETTQEISEKVGEYVWPLPLWDEYEDDIKGHFADLSNIHKDNSRWGGAIQAASFLHQFAKKYPWIHIDMAPRMVSIKDDYLARGSTGEPLKLLVKMVEEYK